MKKVTFTVLAGLAVVAMLATGCKKDEETPAPAPTPAPSLYTRLGGDAAITAVTDQFIANVLADPTLLDDFMSSGATSNTAQYELFRERLIDQLCDATGGPYTYLGATMLEAHRTTGANAPLTDPVTDAEFDALVAALVASLNQFNVPAAEQNDLLAILGPMRTDIVQ